MGALVAAINKVGENVVPTVVTMLRELKHRGNEGHGIATPDMITSAKTFEKMSVNKLNSSIALGHNLSCILPRDQPQPVFQSPGEYRQEVRLQLREVDDGRRVDQGREPNFV